VKAPMLITGLGAVTPVGLTAPQTCAAIRAGLAGFSAPGCRDRSMGPTVQAEVPLLPRPLEARPFGRLVALAGVAFNECIAAARLAGERVAVLIATREPHRSRGERAWRDSALLLEIQRRTSTPFASCSRAFPGGNAAFFLALAQARELLSAGQVDVCVVGGVDSLLNSGDLEFFGSRHRLRSDDVAQGFIPGEGAAFVAVRIAGHTVPLAAITGIGIAQEDPATCASSDAFSTGLGMTRAMIAAMADAELAESEVSFRASDMNGEIYKGYEAMLATSRAYRTRRESFPHLIPAASVGETGAASGALATVCAATAISRGYAAGDHGMCEASSDSGLRGCGVIRSVIEARPGRHGEIQ
jgi:3-oxoacyl-[acyl-carrier-protein] synthase-1